MNKMTAQNKEGAYVIDNTNNVESKITKSNRPNTSYNHTPAPS